MERSTIYRWGKSTISTGPCSIANCWHNQRVNRWRNPPGNFLGVQHVSTLKVLGNSQLALPTFSDIRMLTIHPRRQQPIITRADILISADNICWCQFPCFVAENAITVPFIHVLYLKFSSISSHINSPRDQQEHALLDLLPMKRCHVQGLSIRS